MEKLKFLLALLIITQLLGVSCKKDDSSNPPLYVRIGGEIVVTAIVDQTITNIVTDNRINFFFAALATDPSRAGMLRRNLIDQLGELSGGTQNYTGRTMIVTHTGMMITNMQFDAFMEDFSNAIVSQSLPQKERNELVQLFQSLRMDIVGK